MAHKAGFVSIIGKPNVGKSTLMNALVGEKLSIITPKAQTTRHRILGIVNEEEFQIVFSDTPGIIKPLYGLQDSMMTAVSGALSDADLILFVTDIHEKHDENDVLEKIKKGTIEMPHISWKWNPVRIWYCSGICSCSLCPWLCAKPMFSPEFSFAPAMMNFILHICSIIMTWRSNSQVSF